MKVCFLFRKPRRGDFSIELSFSSAIATLPDQVQYELAISRFYSNGFFKRIYNIIEASLRTADIYHITGDIHYVSYLLRKRRTILTIHDCGSLSSASIAKSFIYRLLWIQLPVRRAGWITVVSQSTKRELLQIANVREEKVRVIPSAVSPAFVSTARPFCSSRPKILQVGTRENKNLPRLFQALHGLPCQLTIVGRLSQSQLREVEKAGIDYEVVHDLSLEDLVRAYQECDLVAFVSLYEGFGMPIIEANAVGRPVLTSNTCSMPEVAGDAACFVDPLDVSAIRRGLERIISDESYRKMLIENGFVNARRFSAHEVMKGYLQLYKEIDSPSRA